MGVSDDECDNGQTGLEIDWDGSAVNYTCYNPQTLQILHNVKPIKYCEYIPNQYMPQHYCINEKIIYNSVLPTFGDHRPLWAMFGEYKFLPMQRWLHNIEHGSIVMLYHPCANQSQIDLLRKIVTSCIRKHIITPSNLLDTERPLALIGWGCRLTMNYVDNQTVISFIKAKALNGPEGTLSTEGQFNKYLIKAADVPIGSDKDDSRICPSY